MAYAVHRLKAKATVRLHTFTAVLMSSQLLGKHYLMTAWDIAPDLVLQAGLDVLDIIMRGYLRPTSRPGASFVEPINEPGRGVVHGDGDIVLQWLVA